MSSSEKRGRLRCTDEMDDDPMAQGTEHPFHDAIRNIIIPGNIEWLRICVGVRRGSSSLVLVEMLREDRGVQ